MTPGPHPKWVKLWCIQCRDHTPHTVGLSWSGDKCGVSMSCTQCTAEETNFDRRTVDFVFYHCTDRAR